MLVQPHHVGRRKGREGTLEKPVHLVFVVYGQMVRDRLNVLSQGGTVGVALSVALASRPFVVVGQISRFRSARSDLHTHLLAVLTRMCGSAVDPFAVAVHAPGGEVSDTFVARSAALTHSQTTLFQQFTFFTFFREGGEGCGWCGLHSHCGGMGCLLCTGECVGRRRYEWLSVLDGYAACSFSCLAAPCSEMMQA